MLTERRWRLVTSSSSAAAICLALGALFVTGCDHPTASDATTEPAATGVVLRANANPDGTTTVTWDTGSNDVGEVYLVDAGNEILLASGQKGSQVTASMKPGSTELRLVTQDHKVLDQLTLTMPTNRPMEASAPSATP